MAIDCLISMLELVIMTWEEGSTMHYASRILQSLKAKRQHWYAIQLFTEGTCTSNQTYGKILRCVKLKFLVKFARKLLINWNI